jgi:hypothetical protein
MEEGERTVTKTIEDVGRVERRRGRGVKLLRDRGRSSKAGSGWLLQRQPGCDAIHEAFVQNRRRREELLYYADEPQRQKPRCAQAKDLHFGTL